jgi:hypothetical protein
MNEDWSLLIRSFRFKTDEYILLENSGSKVLIENFLAELHELFSEKRDQTMFSWKYFWWRFYTTVQSFEILYRSRLNDSKLPTIIVNHGR